MNLHPNDIQEYITLLTKALVSGRGSLTDALFAIGDAMAEVAEQLDSIHDEIAKWDISVSEESEPATQTAEWDLSGGTPKGLARKPDGAK